MENTQTVTYSPITLRLEEQKKKNFQKRLIDRGLTMQEWFDRKVTEDEQS